MLPFTSISFPNTSSHFLFHYSDIFSSFFFSSFFKFSFYLFSLSQLLSYLFPFTCSLQNYLYYLIPIFLLSHIYAFLAHQLYFSPFDFFSFCLLFSSFTSADDSWHLLVRWREIATRNGVINTVCFFLDKQHNCCSDSAIK